MTSLAPEVDVCMTRDDLVAQLSEDVRNGLTAQPRHIPSRWLYDDVGSAIFNEITGMPEYYLTRRETEIIMHHGDEMAERAAGARVMVELGSGVSEKTLRLLDAFTAGGDLHGYVAFDIDESSVRSTVEQLAARYESLRVRGVVGDFDRHLACARADEPRLVTMLGSTLGNMPRSVRRSFLRRISDELKPGEQLLVGLDLVKERERILAAYDDKAGVTQRFSRNLLTRLNRELGADFDEQAFRHVAVWDPAGSCVRIWLESTTGQVVHVPAVGLEVPFAAGEPIHTEVCMKFEREPAEEEFARYQLEVAGWWQDPADDFALCLLQRG